MKILIADDHRLIIDAVAEKLAELVPHAAIVTAFSVEDMLLALDGGVSLALIDLGMPGAHGVRHVADAHQRWPDLKIIVLSGAQDQAVVRAAKEAHIPIRIGVNAGSLDKKILRKYGGVTPERCERIVVEHLQGGRPVAEWTAATHPLPPSGE